MCVRRRVGVCVVFLLVQLSGLFELRQLAVEHVGGGGHRRLRRQQRGDGGSLLRLVLASSDALLRVDRGVKIFYSVQMRQILKFHSLMILKEIVQGFFAVGLCTLSIICVLPTEKWLIEWLLNKICLEIHI